MLDTNTKRRIDTARDILVGKVPDPKSQVEQITIALIYKFMDDMDAESEELGGKRTFFANGFSRYSWAKLMRSGLGGHETLNLYAEAIAKMPENPGIPVLFRSIFKNAYLPYRDPETLKSFLKVIDEFEYDHSERLGDAFEYLLSVLGSQGDAGQFRTPRHIIDFMVKIIDPKKHEKILDPACGTAGFLISSYKHIKDANKETPLTPDEMGALAANIKGYDISPDMVRLSLVNMYLHGFNDPHIEEYDTLSSQDKWNEYADVILANPPFMSPKGGIKPHKRFSVQSKRSEVLFVDYMAEHLTPTGRAAIIVPEGIIFQNGTAYKQLRKMLVENSLVVVISLPAGVFQPYSGVKTSILILDKSLAKQSQHIGFFKVENDGFGLGAQRRPIEQNDLPMVKEEIEKFLQALRNREDIEELELSTGQGVLKEKVAENGEYNLSGERYRENVRLSRTRWPAVPLGEFCSFTTGGTPSSNVSEYYEGGTIPWLVSGDIHKFEIYDCEKRITEGGLKNSNARYLPENSVLIALNGQGKTRGTVAMLRMKATCNQSLVAISPVSRNISLPEYVFWILHSMYEGIRSLTGDNERSGLSITILKNLHVPLPPLEVQQEIVAEIEGYQKVIDGARAVIDNYKPQIPVDPEWEMVSVADVCMVNPKKSELRDLDENTEISFVPMADIGENSMSFEPKKTKKLREVTASYTYFKNDDTLIAKVTPCFENGKAGIAQHLKNNVGFGSSEFYVLRPDKNKIIPKWLFLTVATPAFRTWATPQMTGTGGLQRVPRLVLEEYTIPLPPVENQETIVAEIEAEQALVNSNCELIERFEKKIHATIARVWGEDKIEAKQP